jgi:hypothetical protein
MNSRRSKDEAAGTRRHLWAARGQSYVELAFALPVLAIAICRPVRRGIAGA